MPKSLPPAIRRQIIAFDPTAPDAVSVSAFCRSLGITRPAFYKIRDRFVQEGNAALHPRSHAPKNAARVYLSDTVDIVLAIRKRLKNDGWDAGPQSIWHTAVDEGLFGPKTPSVSTIALILADTGSVDANPRKRPRKSFIRFQRGPAMELWQLDAFEYQLFDPAATPITVYQLVDDSTRFDVGTAAFNDTENGPDAITAVTAAMDVYGTPQELLSDNGSAFNLSRQGRTTAPELVLAQRGCKAITGQIYSPTTQGKNERSHQTLQRFLDAHAPKTLAQVRRLLVDYREYYNHRRHHQGLPGHMTPGQAWDAAEHAPSSGTPIPYSEVAARAQAYITKRQSDATGNLNSEEPMADITIHPATKYVSVDGRALLVPTYLAGSYRRVITDYEYMLFSIEDGQEVLYVPLPVTTAETTRRVQLWKVKGAQIRNPRSDWTRKHRAYEAEHYPGTTDLIGLSTNPRDRS